MSIAASDIERHIARLHGNGRLRVWSLIITFFGDVVALRGGRVALGTLQDAMGLLQIEPGAVRTALSRLAREGWVERERQGRLSFYRLTGEGRASFDEPTKRIYATAPENWDGRWTVAIDAGDNSVTLGKRGFVPLGGKAWIRVGAAGDVAAGDVLFVTGTGSDMPSDLLALWNVDEQAAYYKTLVDNWCSFDCLQQLTPGAAMAARTLLIHDWRRIVLRDPGLPDALLPDDWIGHTARKLVARTYGNLLPGSEKWLDDNSLPAHSEPDAINQRFNVLRNIAI